MTTVMPSTETLRRADLNDLATLLRSQHARAFDVVAGSKSFQFNDAALLLSGVDPIMDEDGVTNVNGIYVPTSVADEGLAEKLGIPISYLRKCRAEMPDLYAQNLNRWLIEDDRRFLLRFLRGDDSYEGVLRAFLSDSYKPIDNIDILMAVLAGIQAAGVENTVVDADLTERRMVVRVAVPGIAVYAPEFLKDYRNPFEGGNAGRGWTPARLAEAAKREGHEVQDKVVFAGFVFSNSETGDGAWTLTPRLVIGPCSNGLQITADALRKTHLGAKLDAGIVRWSDETLKANLTVITKQATDTVRTYLDKEYVQTQVDKLTAKAGETVNHAEKVVAAVSKKLSFTEAQQQLILRHFILGGQPTVGGVMQAVTSAAQVVDNGDTAFDMEVSALRALDIAHQANRELVKAGN